MDFLEKVRQASRAPTPREYSQQKATDADIVQRKNYLILANATELGTEVIFKLLRNAEGLTDKIGNQTMLRTDIANMVATRISNRIQLALGGEQGD